MTTIAFLGMTHLGLVSTVAAASKGAHVLAFDADRMVVEALRRGELPIVEPDLAALLGANMARITFTADTRDLNAAEIIYVSPDVPTDDAGRSNLTIVDRLVELAFEYSRPEATIVVLSQVSPGYSRARARDGRRLFYQVETLIFGRAVERATRPERIIVGCADAGRPLPAAYWEFLCRFDCPILPMRYESAELTKISINFCLIGSLSAANVLAELCEAIGADWSEIVPALYLDSRIGPKAYLKPGLGLSGGNLERDMATVETLAREHGTDTRLVSAWGEGSRIRKDWAYRILHQEVLSRKPNASIGVLGLAYKENTHSTKNSPALTLLAHRDLRHVRVFDPVVSAAIVPHAIQAANALDALQGADAVAVMTPWPAFRAIAPSDMARAMAGRILLDPYALFDSADIAAAGLDRFVLGRPPERVEKGA